MIQPQTKYLFIAACSGMLLFGITMVSLGSILPDIISEYDLSEIAAGTLASLLPAGILAGSLIFGPITDRYGYKYLLIISTVFIILTIEGIAFTHNYFLLRLYIILIGFAGGMINGATNALVNDISSEGRSANISLLGVFYGIGALGMPAVIGLFSAKLKVNVIIAVLGFIMIIPVIYFFLISFPRPKVTQKYPLRESLRMVRDPILILMGFFLFFQSGLEGVTTNWTTTYIQSFIMERKDIALFTLSGYMLSLTITRIFLGWILRKIPSCMVQFISMCIAGTGIFILMFSKEYALTVFGLILLGAGFAAAFPVLLGYVGDLYKKLSGTAFSFVLVIALIGNMTMNYSMGLIFNYFGMKYLSSLLLFCLILLLIIFLIVLKGIRNKVDLHSV
jgi:FHS family glucose/mannose:H+ symporter-like MFS transporter